MSWKLDEPMPGRGPLQLRVEMVGSRLRRLLLPLRDIGDEGDENNMAALRGEVAQALHSLMAGHALAALEPLARWRRVQPQIQAAQRAATLAGAETDELQAKRRRLELEAPDGLAKQLLDIDVQISAARGRADEAAAEVRVLAGLRDGDAQTVRAAVDDSVQRHVGTVREQFRARLEMARTRLALIVQEQLSRAVDEALFSQALSDPQRFDILIRQATGSVVSDLAGRLLVLPGQAPPAAPEATPAARVEPARPEAFTPVDYGPPPSTEELAECERQMIRDGLLQPSPLDEAVGVETQAEQCPADQGEPASVTEAVGYSDAAPEQPARRRDKLFQASGAAE